MFIQEIVIDGFKSYARRTVIEGFDPHFNAITGLNGSGKSNILDSICFVLGISNLSQVRAGNLSELVYKQGQAGVNKATVTIIFNNDDPSSSPVGYEQCPTVTVTRQVLLGGKSKYMVNGRAAPAGQVQNLFHSVQLNVNNPHFLIMQGRITKVLNMKPAEILGMVEEAAGTRLYETKRVAALKTIEKKQAKVDEINRILAEEIAPTLERLRSEKQAYLLWSKNNADLQRMERFVLAGEYYKYQQYLRDHTDDCDELERQLAGIDAESQEYREQIKIREADIEQRSSRIKGDFGQRLNTAKKDEQECSNKLVRVTSVWQHCQENILKAEADVESSRQVLIESQGAVTAKEHAMVTEATQIQLTLRDSQEAEDRVRQLAADYQKFAAGMAMQDGNQKDATTDGRTLPEQIGQAHADAMTAEAKIEQASMRITHLTKQLESLERQIQVESKASEMLATKCEKANTKVSDLKAKIASLSFSEPEYSRLEKLKAELDSAVASLSDRAGTLYAQLQGRLAFKYSEPVRGFDRTKVKGLVAKLIKVHQVEHATALEVVAGGKLYQVVVDDAITGKALLDRGKLERRVTIIPLDKIQPRQVTLSTCQTAANMASHVQATAKPAIELVGFDEEVRSAIEYVFGSTLVVDNAVAANQICDATKTRTVTLDGDVYDPAGTISGGSKNELGTTLSKLAELGQINRELECKTKELHSVDRHLQTLKSAASQFEKIMAQLDLAEAELDNTKKHLSHTRFGVLVEQRDAMKIELEVAMQERIVMQKEHDAKWEMFQTLSEQEMELTQRREDHITGLERQLQQTKEVAAQKSLSAHEAESRMQILTIELESLKAEVSDAQEALDASIRALDAARHEESEAQIKVGNVKAGYDDACEALRNLEEKVSSVSSEVFGLKNELSELNKKLEHSTVQAKKMSIAVARIRKDRSGAEKSLAEMGRKHPWILSEKVAFGIRGGDYDFEACDPGAASKQYRDLTHEQESLAKKINKKVMGMIERAEDEYTELLRKRKVIENDKIKIKKVIEELDVKKKAELQITSVKVNRDFGSIFSTLLPGALAKLEPPEGMEAWEGLEVKVSFGDVWKDSLSELSGGQRSLLALSLILSLLLFKPAPMYILDEVDAALDLSHTQNIGHMLKTHFSQSQFIVVSLKEGMFNNANVIFRTKFVDGVSTVARTIGTGSSRAHALADATTNHDDLVQHAGHKSAASRLGARKGKENSSA